MKNVYRKIYDTVKRIPRGKVAYYGQIAWLCDIPLGARAVGYALSQCPDGSSTPCHRVVDKQGRTKPCFDVYEKDFQRTLLEEEGVTFLPDGRVDMSACLWNGK